MTTTRILGTSAAFVNPDPTLEQMLNHLRRANAIAIRARKLGHHPFGAILVAPDHETVLADQGNINTVNHAESTLVRIATTNFSSDYLWHCTLYTTIEPCAMCTGTLYWGNVGRLVYGVPEATLLQLTGNHTENPTLDLPCRMVLERGQKSIRVWGPFEQVTDEIIAVHQDFWRSPS